MILYIDSLLQDEVSVILMGKQIPFMKFSLLRNAVTFVVRGKKVQCRTRGSLGG